MRVIEVFRFAVRGLRANKLRSGLTTLGILIGVGAVILLIAVGQKSNAATVYGINPKTGALTALHHYPLGKNPNWVEIVDLP